MRTQLQGHNLTVDRASKIEEHRIGFFQKLKSFRTLQNTYMPATIRALTDEDDARNPDIPPPMAENTKLWLPSDLPPSELASGCNKRLPQMEVKLREAQCADALTLVRSRLHAKRHLIVFRNANHVGQRQSTRSRTLIGRIGERINEAADKYRHARLALIKLKGASYGVKYRELLQTDITLGEEVESDTAARKKLGKVGTNRTRNEPSSASQKTAMSWIWTANGGPDDDEQMLHDCKFICQFR